MNIYFDEQDFKEYSKLIESNKFLPFLLNKHYFFFRCGLYSFQTLFNKKMKLKVNK